MCEANITHYVQVLSWSVSPPLPTSSFPRRTPSYQSSLPPLTPSTSVSASRWSILTASSCVQTIRKALGIRSERSLQCGIADPHKSPAGMC